jgi:hypothetical protein
MEEEAVSTVIYNFLYDDRTGLPIDLYTEEDYLHVYRVYPRLL